MNVLARPVSPASLLVLAKPPLVVEIKPSTRKNKRFMAVLSNCKIIHFGQKNASTYIDNHNPDKRMQYIARHYANKKEKELIDNKILSPSLLSLYLLWGMYDTMEENLKHLNQELNQR